MPSTDPGGEAGRVRCLYCGANNFPGSAACWQCSRPLKTMPGVEAANAPGADPASAPLQAFMPTQRSPVIESSLAPKAAAALGLIFPYVGLPVGIVFLMLDDPRKEKLGWIVLGWSILGTILNSIAFGALLALLAPLLKGLTHVGGSPTGVLGLPSLSGDGANLLFPRLISILKW